MALDIPTALPRLSFVAEVNWAPFVKTSSNPFTGRSAVDIGAASIRDNPVELECEVDLHYLTSEQTRGWVGSHFDIVDQFSPSKRPGDKGIYTHKLDLEWDTAFAPFNRLAQGRWLHGVEIEGSLDYLATGVPRAGDVINRERFLDSASKSSFSLVLVLPLTP